MAELKLCPFCGCTTRSCFTAKLKDGFWDDGMEVCTEAKPTNRWCYIDLPED